MSAIFNFIKNHFFTLLIGHVIIFAIGNIVFPSVISLLIQKQNFIYLVSTSMITGKYMVWGFCIFVSMVCLTFFLRIFPIKI